MKRDSMKIFINEIYPSPPKKFYEANKTILESIEKTWSSDLLVMNDYGPSNNKGYAYILVVIDNFSIFGWANLLNNRHAQSLKTQFRKLSEHQTVSLIFWNQKMGRSMLTKTSTFSWNRRVLKGIVATLIKD